MMNPEIQSVESGADLDRARFTAIWERNCVDGVVSRAGSTFEKLLLGYGEAGRCYHTAHHVNHCLAIFDQVSRLTENPDAVEMAIWFHDVVYETDAEDNELRSAQMFLHAAKGQLETDFSQIVANLIMDTLHQERPLSEDGRWLVDIDLSSFGLPWEAFHRDCGDVRQEYSHMCDDEYYAGKIRFLTSLMKRPRFFYTDYFHKRFDKTARENIDRFMTALRSKGYSC